MSRSLQMLSKCGNRSWKGESWPLMMAPEPGAESQSLAAFLLLRGDFAWWGRGWLGGDVYFNASLSLLDPGTPSGGCTVVDAAAGLFRRAYTKMVVELDCTGWRASFAPPPAIRSK